MKKCENKLYSALLIIGIGGLSSYFILKIASETDEFVLVEYFDKIIMVFIVVLTAMVLSSWVTKKKKK